MTGAHPGEIENVETRGVIDPGLMAFLRDPSSYGLEGCPLDVIESHMSFIFLVGDRAYKMKKPLKLDLLDNLTLGQRARNCQRELTLNRVLAPDIYLDVTPVTVDRHGAMQIGGNGTAIEWLIVMRRLREDGLLDHAISAATVQPLHIRNLADVLARFYLRADIVPIDAAGVIHNMESLMDRNEHSLRTAAFGLPSDIVEPLLAHSRTFVKDCSGMIAARVQRGWIRDCHGDLRPEHVYLGPPLCLIDRLEFCDQLRWHDPFEEIADLGLECTRLGAGWIYPLLVEEMATRLESGIDRDLLNFYTLLHGCVRARLAIEHLRFEPDNRAKRQQQAMDGLRMAAEYAGCQL